MKKITVALLMLILIGSGILYMRSPVEPIEWQPDADAGLTNMFVKNSELNKASILHRGKLNAPEDILVTEEGVLYTGLENGDIVSFDVNDPQNVTTIANTGGRPLGIRLDAENNLIVSDPVKGLLKVSPEGGIETLVTEYQGRRLLLIDHHDIAANGDIYFSDASARFGIDNYLYDFIETSATGSVYKYSPATGEISRVMSGLFFANGVALGPNDEYLLVAETGKSRILKYHLSGSRKGETSLFAANLPGMPDNISFNDDGKFWVGIVNLRDWRVEGLAAFPKLRRLIAALPLKWLEPKVEYGFFLGFDTYGNVVANYQGEGKYTSVTSVYEHDSKLYIGSLRSSGIAVIEQ